MERPVVIPVSTAVTFPSGRDCSVSGEWTTKGAAMLKSIDAKYGDTMDKVNITYRVFGDKNQHSVTFLRDSEPYEHDSVRATENTLNPHEKDVSCTLTDSDEYYRRIYIEAALQYIAEKMILNADFGTPILRE
jgi:hypothetical protein